MSNKSKSQFRIKKLVKKESRVDRMDDQVLREGTRRKILTKIVPQ
jgi:hypothetical protein